jgi:hypothetical protein
MNSTDLLDIEYNNNSKFIELIIVDTTKTSANFQYKYYIETEKTTSTKKCYVYSHINDCIAYIPKYKIVEK